MIADFTYAEHQAELQRAARRLFSERSTLTAVRQAEASGTGQLPGLWQEMASLGWLGMAVPAEHGGGGGRFLDLYALCEELGRALVPSPMLDTVALGAGAVDLAGTPAQRRAVLPAVAGGTCLIAAMVADDAGDIGPGAIRATAEHDGWRLDGSVPLVAYAGDADYFLCAATAEGGGATLLLLPATEPGVTLTPLRTIGGVPQSLVSLVGVQAGADAVLGAPGQGQAILDAAVTRAAVLQTAMIVGAAQRVLEITNQYAKDRVQFGIPIGKNQAVQYMVSDVLIDLHTVDLLGRQAAYRIDAGLPYLWEAEIAIVHGKEAAAHLHRQAHEVHAGIAFMAEHPLQLFSRRSKYWENNLGDTRYHYERVAALLCDEVGG